MFNHHKRICKQVKTEKKTNRNKEKNKYNKIGGTGTMSPFPCYCPKVAQQHIEDLTGIKIHSNTFHNTSANLEEGMKYGNLSYDEIIQIKDICDENDLPMEEYKHDKTQWRREKDKTKQRKYSRDEKMNNNLM